ncbi:MAG: phage protein Gp27 family protein [Pseudomonadota bacterium]
MPPPRKVDLLPEDVRAWLQDAMRLRGFGDYEAVTEELNGMLEERGLQLRLGKSSVHAFGQDYREFVKVQEEASAWAEGWLTDEGLEGEAKRHGVLFQMLTALGFKWMRGAMAGDEGANPDDLQKMGRMMKDVMASAGLREKLIEEERRGQAKALEDAVGAGKIDAAAAQAAREAMGLAG